MLLWLLLVLFIAVIYSCLLPVHCCCCFCRRNSCFVYCCSQLLLLLFVCLLVVVVAVVVVAVVIVAVVIAVIAVVQILCEWVRPVLHDNDLESFEVIPIFVDPACDNPANTAVRMNAILADDFAGGVLSNVPTTMACINAYKRYVNFKQATIGIMPTAAPTMATNNGWSLLRAVQQGNGFVILAGVSTENKIGNTDLLKVVLLEDLHMAENFVVIGAQWNQSPSIQAGVNWQIASNRIATTSLLFADT